jgi:uncharacterized membrane protein
METDAGGIWAGCGIGIAVVIVIIAQLASGSARPSSDAGVFPEAILKRRYAQGEIGKEEYEQSYKI